MVAYNHKQAEARHHGFIHALEDANVRTWFDMGLFLDRIRDNRQEYAGRGLSFSQYKKELGKGIGFLTFDYGIDGVSIEMVKYALALEKLFSRGQNKMPNIYWLGGHFKEESKSILLPRWSTYALPGANGFDQWDGYKEYFSTKLDRGGEAYNALAKKLWQQTSHLAADLARYVLRNDISLLVTVNIASNPGNVALTFATVLVSELLNIPVINSSHDFYWEGGKPKRLRKKGEEKGVRDHFFRNAHVGEVFSIIEMLFPWESRLWFQTTINSRAANVLIHDFGFNPVGTSTLPTSIDIRKYRPLHENARADTLGRLQNLFANDAGEVPVVRPEAFLESQQLKRDNPSPVVLGGKTPEAFSFRRANLIFLQPTRILERKRIELNFDLLEKLVAQEKFAKHLASHQNLKVTLLVSGPYTKSHASYCALLVKTFRRFRRRLSKDMRNRFFLAFKFGKETSAFLEKQRKKPVKIEQLYGVSHFVMLPSQTEGRGLPILESASTGVPILVHRYEPEEVFAEVKGEHLDKSMRLQLFEFSGEHFPQKLVDNIAHVLLNPEERESLIEHNREVVRKRFSISALVSAFDPILLTLYERTKSDKGRFRLIKDAFAEHRKRTVYDKAFFSLVRGENRKYTPGVSQIEYMVMLKSLIDPSFFRVEEKASRGRIMGFARRYIERFAQSMHLTFRQKLDFFVNVETLFSWHKGEDELAVDHSLSYRHRNRRHYAYRKLTEEELCGVAIILFEKVVGTKATRLKTKKRSTGLFRAFTPALLELTGAESLRIDDRDLLVNELKGKRPLGLVPSKNFAAEIQLFVLGAQKVRMGFGPDDALGRGMQKTLPVPITLFVRQTPADDGVDEVNIRYWLEHEASSDVKQLFAQGLFKIVPVEVLARGFHLAQLGRAAKKELNELRKNNGVLVAVGDDNMLTCDLLNMRTFRLGRLGTELVANFMGGKVGEGYVQFVPPAMRPSLAYPTPIQTPVAFSKALHRKTYRDLSKKMGEDALFEALGADADLYGTPINAILEDLTLQGQTEPENTRRFHTKKLVGLHEDGEPWSGALVELDLGVPGEQGMWSFDLSLAHEEAIPVLEHVRRYEEKKNKKVQVAWNGGYILNAELVGKLGLPETYIGSPLGLVMSRGKIEALPLFNKAVLLFKKDGSLEISRAHLRSGLSILLKGHAALDLPAQAYNNNEAKGIRYYDLLYKKTFIPAKGRKLYRFVGNTIIDVVSGVDKSEVLPVGLVVSVPEKKEMRGWKIGAKARFDLPGFDDVQHAIEAGPMLMEKGKIDLRVERGGWKTKHSIATQAARVDYTDMRGPKLGVGLSADNRLVAVAINGRIRESVGATLLDLAHILKDRGVVDAMGFDPGGSVTLVANNEQLNISPYNKDYEKNIYTKPPEPRFVGNAVLGILKRKR
ncbi:MAG: phosphodiester glycosidase family protein [Myxococcota bacterium]|nr:phosphodiester glycosidase family protein [Myxococcota bacterium]